MGQSKTGFDIALCVLYFAGNFIRPKYNAIACEKGEGKKERVGERMERKREMGGGGRLEKGRRRGGVRMRESERERKKNHISFIKFGFKKS